MFPFILTLCAGGSSAQSAYTYMDVGNLYGRVYANNYLFNNFSDLSEGLKVPKGGDAICIFASALWIGAYDENNEQRVAANTYHLRGTDFWPGPIKDDGTSGDSTEWSKVWVMTKTMVEDHKLNFANGNYIMPDEVKNWPVNLGAEYTSTYANFKDLNNNGIYEPASGEYPLISGDKEIYFIFNDLYSAHTETTSAKPLGIEVKGKVYGYSSGTLKDALFVKYHITNRSTNNYKDVLAGIWTDFDIGNPANDYVGSSTEHNMYFGYNGTAYDTGYINGPPAMGVLFLNKPLFYTQHYISSTTAGNGEPSNANHYYRLLKSTQRNGLFEPAISFNGNPCDNTGSNEIETPGDRRMVGSTETFTLTAGETVELEIAFVFAQGTNYKESVCRLFEKADEIKTMYNNGEVTSVKANTATDISVKAYPNPGSGQINFTFNGVNQPLNISIYSATGIELMSANGVTGNTWRLEQGTLPKGIYYLYVRPENKHNLSQPLKFVII